MQKKTFTLKPTPIYAIVKPSGLLIALAIIAIAAYYFIDYLQRTDLIWATFDETETYPYVAIVFLVAFAIYLYKVAYILSNKYKISDEQIEHIRGVFSINSDFIELYRVKDLAVRKPFLIRLLTAMHVTLITSDKSHPLFHMVAIPSTNIHEVLRELVEMNRERKGVYEID